MSVDPDLLQALKKQLTSTGAHLVIAQKVVKCVVSAGSAAKRKRPPKATGKERVMCLTAEPRVNKKGLKGMLNSCKLLQGRLQVTQSWRLKLISQIEVLMEQGTGRPCLQLTIMGGTLSKKEELAFELLGPAANSMDFLGTLVLFFKQYEEAVPTVSGHDPGALERWTLAHQNTALEGLGQSGRGGAQVAGGGADKGARGVQGNQITGAGARQERDLAELLQDYGMDLGDTQHFKNQKLTELDALENANAQSIILASRVYMGFSDVSKVVHSVDACFDRVEEVSQRLSTIDDSMRSTRADIAAFEARNNAMERAKTNQKALEMVLEKLLQQLRLPHASARLLASPNFNNQMIDQTIEAGWDLVKALHPLDSSVSVRPIGAPLPAAPYARRIDKVISKGWEGVDPSALGATLGRTMGGTLGATERPTGELDLTPGSALGSIAAVSQQRNRLQSASAMFATAARAHITTQLNLHIDAAGGRRGEDGTRTTTLAPPDLSGVHAQLNATKKLLQVLSALSRPEALAQASATCTAVNSILRNNLQRIAAAFKRSCAASAPAAAELDMSKMTKQEDLLPTRETDSASNLRGFRQVLGAWIPCLLSELDFCRSIVDVCERPGSRKVSRSGSDLPVIMAAEGLAAVVHGLDSCFWDMADAVSKSFPLASLAMLATVQKWSKALNSNPDGHHLSSTLQGLAARLVSAVFNTTRSLAASVEKYDSRNAVGISEAVKWQHILPFMPALTMFMTACEHAVAVSDPGSAPPSPRVARAMSFHSKTSSRGDAEDSVLGMSPDELFAAAAMGGSIAQLSSRLPAANTAPSASQVGDASVYLKQQMDNAKLLSMDMFAQRLEDYLASGGQVDQAAAIMDIHAPEFKAMLVPLASTEKKLAAMHARIVKHFGGGSTSMTHSVWSALAKRLQQKYSLLAKHAPRMYPSVQLPITPGHLQELLVVIG
ncbi:hypothetical protein WJX73_009620 [Symbiochloris irregularis]|uniref:Exocyst complex component Sec3 coiled-coil domain-containing protein n=1 Tax=Symbiochloris irregularis TaxID=706552 RepID=A0AAW1NLA7_9CHLO